MAEQDHGHRAGSAPLPHWYSPGAPPLTIVEGDGAYVYDDAGREYLDFVSQLYCVNAGHGNETILEAMRTQLERIQYVAPSKHNDTRTALAERLVGVAPDGLTDVMFSITGSEANELAIQLAREYQGAPKVLTRWRSYHGSTYGAAALTGDPDTRTAVERYAATTGYAKFLPPLARRGAFEADSEAELARQAGDHLEYVIRNEGPDAIAAIVMEPVGGTSGAYPAPAGYFARVRELCDEHDILLIADEVITGFGRTGEWFGSQTADLEPDMLTFAKGCTSAYAPLAGVLTGPDLAAHVSGEGFDLGQTFGGHPVSCAAGLGAMDAYEDGLLARVGELSPYLEERLGALATEFAAVNEVRGRGFLWSVEFADPETGEPFFDPWVEEGENPVAAVREAAREEGVLFGAGRPDDQIIVSPPFVVDRDDLDRGVAALAGAIETVFA